MQGELNPALVCTVDDLIIALTQVESIDDKQELVQALGKFQHHAYAAVPALIAYLDSPSIEVRVESAKALMRIAPSESEDISKILERVNDADDTEKYAVRMLGKLGTDAGEHLAWLGNAAVTFNTSLTALAVIEELEEVASPAVPGLIELLPRTHHGNRSLTIRILGIIGPDAIQALPALKTAFDNEPATDSPVALNLSALIKSLVQLDPGGLNSFNLVREGLNGEGKVPTIGALEASILLDNKSIAMATIILELFDDPSSSNRSGAARAISPYALENPGILDALVGLLGDEDAWTRAAAYSSLVEITLAKPQLKADLEELISTEPNCDLDYAPLILGLVLDDDEACSQLSAIVSSDVYFMRIFAYEELAARGPGMAAAVPALLEQSTLSNPLETMKIAYAICRIDAPKAVPLLPFLSLQLNSETAMDRQKAAWLLGEIGYPAMDAVSALESTCYDWDLAVREEAARAIAKIKHL